MSRLLGIDYGLKRIGLAITDELRIIASPYDIQANNDLFWEYLSNLVREYKISGFVIGKPIHEGKNSFEKEVFVFINKINNFFNLPIYLQDESLSSQESRDFLIKMGQRGKKLKQNLDKYAAQNILSNFLINLQQGKIEQYEKNENASF